METTPIDRDTLNRAIVERAATLLVEALVGSLSPKESSVATATNGGSTIAKYVRTKTAKGKKRKRAANIPDQVIAQLIRERGQPLSVDDIMGVTGLGKSAVQRKLVLLQKGKSVKKVKEGKIVRFDVVRGGHARRSSKKTGKRGSATAAAAAS